MCSRYCLETPSVELQQLLSSWLRPDDSAWLKHYAPRDLIRPHEPVLAVRCEHGEVRLSHMLWGLLPGWVKDPLRAPRPINARAETIGEKAAEQQQHPKANQHQVDDPEATVRLVVVLADRHGCPESPNTLRGISGNQRV